VLSHLHADRWDRIATRSLPKTTPVLTTPAAAKALSRRGWGATADLRPRGSHEFTRHGRTLRVTSAPGVHGPGPLGRLLPPAMGSVLELVDGTVSWRGYITGDTISLRPSGSHRPPGPARHD